MGLLDFFRRKQESPDVIIRTVLFTAEPIQNTKPLELKFQEAASQMIIDQYPNCKLLRGKFQQLIRPEAIEPTVYIDLLVARDLGVPVEELQPFTNKLSLRLQQITNFFFLNLER